MTNEKRELRLINRALDKSIRQSGEGVLWYEWHGEASTHDDYLGSGTRRYLAPIGVPVLWITEVEAEQEAAAEGERRTPTIRFATSVEKLVKSGLSDPHDSDRHLNDLVLYQRTLYGVGSFQLRGRLGREDVLVGVSATKIFPDEDMVFDVLPPGIEPNETRRPKPDYVEGGTIIFPDHELPARQT